MSILLQANVGGLSEATVRAAYETVFSNGASNAMYGIVSLIAVIIMGSKLLGIYQKGVESGDRKVFLDMLKKYVMYAIFIAVFPFLIALVENVFGEMQDNLKSKYNTSLESSGVVATESFLREYLKEEMETAEEEKGFLDGLNPITTLAATITSAVYLFCIYLLKYIYFFFCCGRYMWLMMLQVLAPVALILALSEKTISYFYTWLKNMMICYLLIPFFLLADSFSEGIIGVICKSADISVYGLLAVLGMVVIKITMFSYVSKKAYSLL